ncbi:hypothetical protein [Tepidibacillus marianensis]|uniref:hypothetical protein n=1 Tax=Tepidibacillus marianensis TaxID=3131995 RepID=UPI0030D4A424
MEINSILHTFFQTRNLEQAKTLQLKTGQLVQGKALDLFNNQFAMVSINGMKVIAKTEVPLEKGQKAWFMVMSAENELPKLKLLNTYNQSTSKELPILELIKSLQFNDTPEIREIVSFFIEKQWPLNRESIRRIELYMEQNQERIASVLREGNFSEEFRSVLESTFLQQAGVGLSLERGDQPFTQTIFQFPNFLPLSDQPVYLQVHSKKKGTKMIDPDDVRLAFLFQFPNLGEMMIQIHLYQKQIIVGVYNNHAMIREIMKSIGSSFEKFIREQGYQTSGIQVRSMKDLREQQHRFQSTTTVYQGVDIRI